MDELDCEDLEGSDFCFVEMKRSRRSIGLTEKKTLLEIVRRADDGRVLKTLENPDPKTNALKKKAWLRVTTLFNLNTGLNYSREHVRKMYQRVKNMTFTSEDKTGEIQLEENEVKNGKLVDQGESTPGEVAIEINVPVESQEKKIAITPLRKIVPRLAKTKGPSYRLKVDPYKTTFVVHPQAKAKSKKSTSRGVEDSVGIIYSNNSRPGHSGAESAAKLKYLKKIDKINKKYKTLKLRYLAGKNILLEAQMRERGIDVPELCYVSSSSDSD